MTKRNKNIKKAIKATKGRIFRTTFVKQNGDLRELIGRVGVSKGISGKGRKMPENCAIVYDMKNRGYRTIVLNNILEMKLYGREYRL